MTAGRRNGDPLDVMDTPEAATRALLADWRPRIRIRRIIEPAAGAGAMLEPLRERFPSAIVDSVDIAPRHEETPKLDFLAGELPSDYDLAFSNPPFLTAREFVDAGLQRLRAGGYLVYLLRTAFIESEKRKSWWRSHMPEEIVFISNRPSFYKSEKGSSSDSSSYAWFIWRNTRAALTAPSSSWRLLR